MVLNLGLFVFMYAVVVLTFAGAYAYCEGFDYEKAVLFSIDTLCARGRSDDPSSPWGCRIAAAESIIGHVCVGLFFAIWVLPPREPRRI